jgi:hypothetical protein
MRGFAAVEQDLINRYEQAFAAHIETLQALDERYRDLENLEIYGLFEAPVIGDHYAIASAPYVQCMTYRALGVRLSWAIQGPPRSPPLPLSDAEIDKLLASKNTRWRLEGYYAQSQRQTDWDPRHPSYNEFRDRLMWSPNVPSDLADDQDLLGETLPESLPGFDDETLCWLAPETERFVYQIRRIMGPGAIVGVHFGLTAPSCWLQPDR